MCVSYYVLKKDYDNLDRFFAIASSTALNCFSSSSRRLVFFEEPLSDDSDLEAEKFFKQNKIITTPAI